jgi:16S rRNA (guanine966-N2)-methyltransferase
VQTTGQGHVRIIAGTLRGSKLPVPVREGLRPTPDRTRETLFNWLAMKIAGRRVLDVFAGSGALGFEAASRDAAAADSLRASQERLNVAGLRIIQTDALSWLGANSDQHFDGVFLDPPFASALWPQIWPLLLPLLSDGAWLYMETAVEDEVILPAGLVPYKSGKSKHSKYLLAQWHKTAIG